MSVRLVRMQRHKAECFALLPKLTDAMLALGLSLNQRNIAMVCRRYEADFVADGQPLGNDTFYEPQWAAWLAWDDEAQAIRGHLVAAVELFADTPVVYVQHLEIVSKLVPQDVRDQAQAELEAWARSKGCAEIMMMTRFDYPRLWRPFGFKRWRALYRKEL